MTSRKPVVATIAPRGEGGVMRAFVATVEPCEKTVTSRRSTLAAPRTPSITASIASAGVDGTFATEITPVSSSSTQMSVNVPPTSQATRKRVTIASAVRPSGAPLQLVDHEQPGRLGPVVEAPVHVVGRQDEALAGLGDDLAAGLEFVLDLARDHVALV